MDHLCKQQASDDDGCVWNCCEPAELEGYCRQCVTYYHPDILARENATLRARAEQLERELEISRAARHAIETTVGDDYTSTDEPGVLCGIRNMHARIEQAERERDNLRELFEHVTRKMWDETRDLDWDDLQEWQSEAERLGLLVTVPASDEFKAEWGGDTMLSWSWSALGRAGEE